MSPEIKELLMVGGWIVAMYGLFLLITWKALPLLKYHKRDPDITNIVGALVRASKGRQKKQIKTIRTLVWRLAKKTLEE
jgi:hypothetical protein